VSGLKIYFGQFDQAHCVRSELCINNTPWVGRGSVSDIQTRGEGESLYIRYGSAANVLSYLKNDPSYEFIVEVILKIYIV
jgi:hypothetical protein